MHFSWDDKIITFRLSRKEAEELEVVLGQNIHLAMNPIADEIWTQLDEFTAQDVAENVAEK